MNWSFFVENFENHAPVALQCTNICSSVRHERSYQVLWAEVTISGDISALTKERSSQIANKVLYHIHFLLSSCSFWIFRSLYWWIADEKVSVIWITTSANQFPIFTRLSGIVNFMGSCNALFIHWEAAAGNKMLFQLFIPQWSNFTNRCEYITSLTFWTGDWVIETKASIPNAE